MLNDKYIMSKNRNMIILQIRLVVVLALVLVVVLTCRCMDPSTCEGRPGGDRGSQ